MYVAKRSDTHLPYVVAFDYDADAVAFLRTLRDGYGPSEVRFDGKLRAWLVRPTKAVAELLKRFPNATFDDAVRDDVAAHAERQAGEVERLISVLDLKATLKSDYEPQGVKTEHGTLFPYQKLTVDFIRRAGGRCLVAHEMGLGKGLNVLAYAVDAGLKKLLVVCPATVKLVWEKETDKWTDYKAKVLNLKSDVAAAYAENDVLVVNYDVIRPPKGGKENPLLNALLKLKFDLVVADEVHKAKNAHSQQTEGLSMLVRNCRRFVGLTGTPILSRPIELFVPLNLIAPEKFGVWHDYASRYCGLKRVERWNQHLKRKVMTFETKGAENLDELANRIAPYYIRFEKKDVALQLPEKIYETLPIEMDKTYARRYKETMTEVMKALDDNVSEGGGVMKALTELNRLRQITSDGKVSSCIEMVDDWSEQEKVLVFSVYNAPLKDMKEHFGDKAVLLVGSSSETERLRAVDAFQNDPNVRVFLGGTLSAGVGITLTAASRVVFLDYSWVPADHLQAQDRIHRVGSRFDSVTITQLVVPNTIDDAMRSLLEDKKEIFDAVFGDKKNVTSVMVDSIIRRLFRGG